LVTGKDTAEQSAKKAKAAGDPNAAGQAAPKQPQPKVGGDGSGQEAGPKKEGFWHWVGRKLGFIQDDEKKSAAPVSQGQNAQATGTNLVVGATEAAANGAGGTSALSVTAKAAASEGSTGAAGIAGAGNAALQGGAALGEAASAVKGVNFYESLVDAATDDPSAAKLYSCCGNQIREDAREHPAVFAEKYQTVKDYMEKHDGQYPDHW
jgi:hypothetical protein